MPTDSNKITFRPFEFEDHQKIYPLECLYRNCKDSFDNFLAKATRHSLFGMEYLNDDHFVIEAASEVAGYLKMTKDPRDNSVEVWIFLKPEFHNSGCGIAAWRWACQRALQDQTVNAVVGKRKISPGPANAFWNFVFDRNGELKKRRTGDVY